jgi:fucose permease
VLCDLFPERKGRVLNQNQIFYNVGAIAMPLVASWVLALNLGWRPGFVVAAVGCAACGLWINLLPAPVRPEAPGPDPTRGNDPSASVALLVALAAMMFLYVGGEMTAANWASNYLEETFGAGRAAAARVPALFWLCMLAGRLVYVAFVERWNYLWPILVSSLFAAAAGAAAVFAAADWQAVAAVAAVGLGLSGIWPTILAYASRRFPGRGYVFSVVVAVGSAGLLVFPPLCGLIAERSPWRLRAGMALIAATLAGVAALAGALLAVERSRGES